MQLQLCCCAQLRASWPNAGHGQLRSAVIAKGTVCKAGNLELGHGALTNLLHVSVLSDEQIVAGGSIPVQDVWQVRTELETLVLPTLLYSSMQATLASKPYDLLLPHC